MSEKPSIVLSNRYLHAEIDPGSGALIALRESAGAENLIASSFCFHGDGTASISENPRTPNSRPFDVRVSVQNDRSVVATLRSASVEVRRRIELHPSQPMLVIEHEVRGLGGPKLKFLAFPRMEFTPDFPDAFEDDRDLYDDGAELGDWRELPCWRVFFRQGRDDGLIVATRSKRDMSRFQIAARGFDIFPHEMVAYDTDTELRFPAMDVSKGKKYVARFEIGPWSRARHSSILRGAQLSKPVKTNNPPPRGRRPKVRAGKMFYAAKFARTSAVSERFHRKRWMRAKLPWARNGRALFAGTGVHPPALRLDPKLKGVYRIFIGAGNGDGVEMKLSGEPEPLFRYNDSRVTSHSPFELQMSGRQDSGEVFCGTHEMDGRKLELRRFPDPHAVCMIDYVRFEKLSPPELRRWQRTQNTPTCVPVSGMVDVPDIAPLTNPLDPSPAAYRSVIREHARCGIRRIHWRIDGQCCDYPSKLNTMRYVSAKLHGVFCPQGKAYGRALGKWDMLRLAVDTAHRHGLEIFGWQRFNAYFGNVQSDFFKQNRDYWEEWENGWRGGKLCLAIPQVRAHKLDILLEAASYGLDGLQLGFLRHPPIVHYHPILVEGYREKYGTPPPRAGGGKDDIHRTTLPEMDGEYPRWYQYRADFMTLFGRELRTRLHQAGLGHLKISIWVRPNHALFDGLDMDAWLNEGLCDEVIADAQVPTDARLPITDPTEQWREMVQAKVPLYRGIWANDLEWAKAHVPRFIREGYDGINIYESNMAVLDTGNIKLLEGLRQPARKSSRPRSAEAVGH